MYRSESLIGKSVSRTIQSWFVLKLRVDKKLQPIRYAGKNANTFQSIKTISVLTITCNVRAYASSSTQTHAASWCKQEAAIHQMVAWLKDDYIYICHVHDVNNNYKQHRRVSRSHHVLDKISQQNCCSERQSREHYNNKKSTTIATIHNTKKNLNASYCHFLSSCSTIHCAKWAKIICLGSKSIMMTTTRLLFHLQKYFNKCTVYRATMTWHTKYNDERLKISFLLPQATSTSTVTSSSCVSSATILLSPDWRHSSNLLW